MGVDVAVMDGFVEVNHRIIGTAIQGYEGELERVINFKRERICEFIANACTEIESLWEKFMIGEEDDFAAFSDTARVSFSRSRKHSD